MDLASKFESGLTYSDFLAEYGGTYKDRWDVVHNAIQLSDAQTQLLASFGREMKVLVLAGTWCGDCVDQCPILDRFAGQNDKINIRYFDRDANPDLGELLSTCGAARVPAVLFLSEDNAVCGRYGDRTLTRYREMATMQLGGDAPQDVRAAVVQEWLNEFERIQLMLRLSGRLRQLHAD
jgi:thiol-disulfide isomerase/thioredoxin